MGNGFYDEYENRLLTDGSDNDEEELESEVEEEETDESEEYYELPLALKSRSLIWSVVSFVAGVLSLALCLIYYVSLPFAAGAIVCSLVSRKNLGFFEKYGITGLTLGIMGIVCGIFSGIASSLGIFG